MERMFSIHLNKLLALFLVIFSVDAWAATANVRCELSGPGPYNSPRAYYQCNYTDEHGRSIDYSGGAYTEIYGAARMSVRTTGGRTVLSFNIEYQGRPSGAVEMAVFRFHHPGYVPPTSQEFVERIAAALAIGECPDLSGIDGSTHYRLASELYEVNNWRSILNQAIRSRNPRFSLVEVERDTGIRGQNQPLDLRQNGQTVLQAIFSPSSNSFTCS